MKTISSIYKIGMAALFFLGSSWVLAAQGDHARAGQSGGVANDSTDTALVLRKFVVADLETKVPVRDAMVITSSGYRDTTNYRGVCYIPTQLDTLIVYKANYLSEKLVAKEVGDTTYLLPNSHRVSEVTVWGQDRQRRLEEAVERWAKEATNEPRPSNGILSFDLGNILDRRGRRDAKQLRKMKKAFRKMDEKGNEDPIKAAYNKTMEEKRLAAERKKLINEAQQKYVEQKEDSTQQLIKSYEQKEDTTRLP